MARKQLTRNSTKAMLYSKTHHRISKLKNLPYDASRDHGRYGLALLNFITTSFTMNVLAIK